jgi:4-amino-4-deoxy-L-arabinose transferase-like glycosyltransferase
MRIISIILAVFNGINGFAMLAVPAVWYQAVPGVALTGPCNGHFVRDIGLGFLAAANALALFAYRRDRAVLWPAVVFLGGHALLHLCGMLGDGVFDAAVLRDLALIVIPGLMPAALLFCLPRRRQAEPGWAREKAHG